MLSRLNSFLMGGEHRDFVVPWLAAGILGTQLPVLGGRDDASFRGGLLGGGLLGGDPIG
ncbi:MAG: hypothetical protein ACRDJU_03250 [Actinomycetota bacterium]